MTEVPPADRYVWRASAQTQAEERTIDTQARARAGRRNDGWVRFAGLTLAMIGVFLPVRPFTAATVIVLDVLAIYGIAVHGDRARTRFYVDRA